MLVQLSELDGQQILDAGDAPYSLTFPLARHILNPLSQLNANFLDYLGLMPMSAPFQSPRIFRPTPVWARLRLLLLDLLLIIGRPVK